MKKVIRVHGLFTTGKCKRRCSVQLHKFVMNTGVVFYLGECPHNLLYWCSLKLNDGDLRAYAKFLPETKKEGG